MNVKLLLNKQVKELYFLQRLLPVMIFFLLSAAGLQAQTDAYTAAGLPVPTVSSDKDDYAPGEVAIITGTGWTFDQQVDVHFEETPAFHAEHQHDHHGIAVDAIGNWTIRYQIEQRHFGVAFDVHVVGKQSGAHAHTFFTDGGVQFKASGLPDPTSVTISSIKYIQQGNNFERSEEKLFIAPNGSESLSNPAAEGTTVYFKYPKSITRSDGLIYTLENDNIKAFNAKNNDPVTTLAYDNTTQLWRLIAIKDAIIVTAAYKLSTSPTTLSISSASGTYGGTTTLTATLTSGTNNLNGKIVSFKINGEDKGSATTNSSGVATLSNVSLAGINASTTAYVDYVTASYAGETGVYQPSSGKNNLSIGKAATETVVTLSAGPFTYTGSAITPATVSVTGPGLDLTPDATYADNVNAGTATASYTYAETANYLASIDSKSFAIGKADATINVVVGGPYTFDNTAKSVSSATVTGVGGVSLGAATVVYKQSTETVAAPTNAGEYEVHASFAGNDNYKPASDNSKVLTIRKAGATIALSNLNHMHDGSAKSAIVSTTPAGLNGVAVTYNSSSTAPTAAGSYAVVATLTNANYRLVNAEGSDIASVTGVLNIYAVPVVTLRVSDPVQVNSSSTITATFEGDVFAKEWQVIAPNGAVATYSTAQDKSSFTITSSTVGVYTVTLQYQNGIGAILTSEKMFAVFFDPSAGFVTGGGWIDSPLGASKAFPEAVGKASCGFVSKYEKGAKIPTGNTEFQFKAGDLNFKSTSYQWLTVSGARAQYKGTGTINGLGSYGFMLTAIDGQVSGGNGVDRFRIKIWNGTDETSIVYDNQMGEGDDAVITTAITGSIVIHTPPTKGTKAVHETAAALEAFEPETGQFYNYPNNFSKQTTIAFVLDTEESYSLEVYNLNGILIKKVAEGTAEAGRRYEYELNAEGMAQGMLIGRLVTRSGTRTIKMIRVN